MTKKYELLYMTPSLVIAVPIKIAVSLRLSLTINKSLHYLCVPFSGRFEFTFFRDLFGWWLLSCRSRSRRHGVSGTPGASSITATNRPRSRSLTCWSWCLSCSGGSCCRGRRSLCCGSCGRGWSQS